MLDSSGFDQWAADYDKSVNAADDDSLYPFAGYGELMAYIYKTVMDDRPAAVLDVGVGTGALAHRLYMAGNRITGVDFSGAMLEKARELMPDATLIEHDITKGLPQQIRNTKFDYIISTYTLHHLTDEGKTRFILSALEHLHDKGAMIIGDVSFLSREALEECRVSCGNGWDDDEHYFVFSELKETLGGKCALTYRQISHCAGILEISRNHSNGNTI